MTVPVVSWRGTSVSADMVPALDDLAGSVAPLVVPIPGYGSYRDNPASGGTDTGSGHLDIYAATAGWTDADRAAFVAGGRQRGFEVFERLPRWWSPVRGIWLTASWAHHFHLILKDSADLSAGARTQLAQWYAGSNGLAGFTWGGVWRYDPDPSPRTFLRQTWTQYLTTKELTVATEQDAIDLFTRYAVVANALAPDPATAPRVAPSFLLEGAARLANDANDNAAAAKASADALAGKLDTVTAGIEDTVRAAVAAALAGLSVTLTTKPSA